MTLTRKRVEKLTRLLDFVNHEIETQYYLSTCLAFFHVDAREHLESKTFSSCQHLVKLEEVSEMETNRLENKTCSQLETQHLDLS